jgi:hypothetical protein
MDKMPDYPSSWVPFSGDRDFGRVDGGHLELGTFKAYSRKQLSSYTEDQASVYGGSARGRSFQSSYGVNPVLMSSANGSKYWVRMGYGSDGHSFRIWAEATKPIELCGNWEIVYGTYTLDNSANIDMVFVGGVADVTIPSGCSFTVYVSNNNGTDWETFDHNSDLAHVFSTAGTQLRIKLSATGHPNKSPFIQQANLVADFGSMHDAAKNANIKFKISRKKLR